MSCNFKHFQNEVIFKQAFIGLVTLFIFSPAQAYITLKNIEPALVGFTFNPKTRGLLEQDLAAMNDKISQYCKSQKIQSQQQKVCLWPPIYNEFITYGKKLSDESFDSTRLALTLAGRLHPLNLIKYYEKGNGFDVDYARFLIAQRLLKELWFNIPQKLRAQRDKYVYAWLTARTPFSFLLQLSRQYSCLNGSRPECYHKRKIIGLLQKVSTVIRHDTEMNNLVETAFKETKNPYATDSNDKIYKNFTNALSGESAGSLIVFSSHLGATPFSFKSVQSYFKHVDQDSQQRLSQVVAFSGSACKDIQQTLDLAKQAPTPWGHLVRRSLDCHQNKTGALYSIKGPAYNDLQKHHLLWRFNFYQLRLMIQSLFSSAKSIHPDQLEKIQIHEALKDFKRVRAHIDSLPSVDLEALTRPILEGPMVSLKPTMFHIYNSVLKYIDRAIELKGRERAE